MTSLGDCAPELNLSHTTSCEALHVFTYARFHTCASQVPGSVHGKTVFGRASTGEKGSLNMPGLRAVALGRGKDKQRTNPPQNTAFLPGMARWGSRHEAAAQQERSPDHAKPSERSSNSRAHAKERRYLTPDTCAACNLGALAIIKSPAWCRRGAKREGHAPACRGAGRVPRQDWVLPQGIHCATQDSTHIHGETPRSESHCAKSDKCVHIIVCPESLVNTSNRA